MSETDLCPDPRKLLERGDTISELPLALRSGLGQTLSSWTWGSMCEDSRACKVRQGWLNHPAHQRDRNAANGPRYLSSFCVQKSLCSLQLASLPASRPPSSSCHLDSPGAVSPQARPIPPGGSFPRCPARVSSPPATFVHAPSPPLKDTPSSPRNSPPPLPLLHGGCSSL